MLKTEKHVLLSEGKFQVFECHGTGARSRAFRAGIREGSVLVYYGHTTGAVIILEHEAGILVDLADALAQIAPVAYAYKHHLRGGTLTGPPISVAPSSGLR